MPDDRSGSGVEGSDGDDDSTTESDDGDDAGSHLTDVPDGAGCTEIWEHLSDDRDEQ